jgi:MYXO-CTERM domain-containing protein
VDADGDGARSVDGSTVVSNDLACDADGEATGSASADCNDSDASIAPGAEEVAADGIYSDCDGAELCYTDYDGDGYRPDEYSEIEGDLLCTGAGLVGADSPAGDCDDGDAAINPEGIEGVADGRDSNCDGVELCYVDEDVDGFRTEDGATVESDSIDCTADGVAGSDSPDTDCDDTRADVNPDQGDAIGDELDADCDGFEHCYVDADGDGYRTTEVVESIDDDCQDAGEATMDVPLVDCDDTRAGVNPGADEIEGDGVDQDCDGTDPAGDAVASDDTASPSGSADGDASDAPIEVTVEMEAPAEKGGCSTVGAASGGATGWGLALLGLAGLRRRRAA